MMLTGCFMNDAVESASTADPNPPTSNNNAPTISGKPPSMVKVGVNYSFTPTASDPDSDPMSFSIQNIPNWANFDSATGYVSGVPFLGSEGTYDGIVISVSDGSLSTSMSPFLITVESATANNLPPEIDGIPAASVTVGSAYSFTPSASDPDGDPLTFTVQNLPAWAMFDTGSGQFSGIPQPGDEGTYANISISVSDGTVSASLPAFSIAVEARNSAPVISGTPDSDATVGVTYSFTPSASDPDGNTLTFSIQNMPGWATFNTVTGQLSGSAQSGDVGHYSGIAISVSDGQASATLSVFSITVAAANSAPTISGSPLSQVTVGQTYSFTPAASDPDGDTLSFNINNKPVWASFATSSGRLAGTPGSGDEGSYSNIVIIVTDGTDSSSLAPFSITVNAAPINQPPTISGTPEATAAEGSAYVFVPTASDPEVAVLTFTITGKPNWTSFDSTSGRLSGTPAATDVGMHGNIVISVSDGERTASLVPFTITVVAANSPPLISGSPDATVIVGTAYDFIPTSSDPDGNSLTFSVIGLQTWASFDPTSGRLSGPPGAGDVGMHGGIVITVSDGEDNASLGPFAITVESIGMGSATLSWTAPSENEDNSPLTDLAGYKIYWGTTPGIYPHSVTINNPGIATYVIENLAPGTYEFVSTAFNSAGVEGAYSNTATKTIP